MTQKNTKQPKVLPILFWSELTARFCYWGIQSLLILFLINYLHLQNFQGYIIFGLFTASTFALSILGGLLGDKLFGYRKTLISGICVALVGNILLCIHGSTFMYLGLACISYGIGIFLPNNSNLLGSFYDKNDGRRDRGFTILYMGTNLGGLLGPVCSGLMINSFGFYTFFFLNSLLLASWLVLYAFTSKWFSRMDKQVGFSKKTSFELLFIVFIAAIFSFGLFMLLRHPSSASDLLDVIGIATLILVLYAIYTKYRNDVKNLMMLIFMTLLALSFFACEFQVDSSLLEFSYLYVDRHIGIITIPTQMLAALEPAFVIICAPLIAYAWNWLQAKNREPTAYFKITIGIMLTSLAFFVFAITAHLISATVKEISILWILLGNLLLGAAEICIMPTLISNITKLAPQNFKSTLMGALYVALAFSGYFAGLIAKMTNSDGETSSIHDFTHIYYKISLWNFNLAIILITFLLTYVSFKGILNTVTNKLLTRIRRKS